MPPDATRVKELEDSIGRHKRAAVFQEERALLRKESLENREIENGRILLHLGEVRIHGCGERRRRPQTDAQIEASASVEIVGAVRDARATGKHVGLPLDASRRPDRSIEHQMPPARDFALLTSRLCCPTPLSRSCAESSCGC